MFIFDCPNTGRPSLAKQPAAEVLEFAELLLSLQVAHDKFLEAKASVPHYTAQWRDEYYYAAEEQEYYNVAQKIYDILQGKSK